MRTSRTIDCTSCSHVFSFAARDHGKVSACPKCGATITLIPNGNSKTLNKLLRWLAVIPGAIGCYLLALFFAAAAGTDEYEGGGSSPDLFMIIFGNCLAGSLSVWVGSKIAPSHKFGTAILLTVLMSVLFTSQITIGTLRYNEGFNPVLAIFGGLLAIGSALITSFSILNSIRTDERIKEIRARKELEQTQKAKDIAGNPNN